MRPTALSTAWNPPSWTIPSSVYSGALVLDLSWLHVSQGREGGTTEEKELTVSRGLCQRVPFFFSPESHSFITFNFRLEPSAMVAFPYLSSQLASNGFLYSTVNSDKQRRAFRKRQCRVLVFRIEESAFTNHFTPQKCETALAAQEVLMLWFQNTAGARIASIHLFV